MKLLAVLALIFSTNFLNADSSGIDPFEPMACVGPSMTPTRALELLGNRSSVNLMYIASNETAEFVNGIERWRNVINGVAGDWNLGTYWPLKPFIANVNGQLHFQIRVFTPNMRNAEDITCAPYGRAGASHVCRTNKKSEVLKDWGTGDFLANLTNNCMKIWYGKSYPGIDKEWAYFIQF